MSPQIFLLVVLMLALKYTLELAGRTETFRASLRRRRPMSSDRVLQHPGRLFGGGLMVVGIGWLAADGATTATLVLVGLGLTHGSMFAAGRRRRARPAVRAEGGANRQPSQVAVTGA